MNVNATEVAAIIAAAAAIFGAFKASRAATKTTKLAADLAEGGELKRWQRDHLLTVIAELLQVSDNTYWAWLSEEDRERKGLLGDEGVRQRILANLQRATFLTNQVRMFGTFALYKAAVRLCRAHIGESAKAEDHSQHVFNAAIAVNQLARVELGLGHEFPDLFPSPAPDP